MLHLICDMVLNRTVKTDKIHNNCFD